VGEPLRGLTVMQPWAGAIAYGTKRVENRTWAVPARLMGSWIAIHAGKRHDYGARLPEGCEWPEIPAMIYGAVLAVAKVAGHCQPRECDGSCSPWAVRGQDHWHLIGVRALPEPVPCKGALGVWKLPKDVEKAVREQLGECDA